MTEKTLNISGNPVKMKSPAAIPRLFRIRFGWDVFKDLSKLKVSCDKKRENGRRPSDRGPGNR